MSHVSVALVGCPNCGKSALFNALTGARQKVGNYPGVTVERKYGNVLGDESKNLCVIDLPGLYSLKASSPDEEISVQTLIESSQKDKSELSGVVVVLDSTSLERTLGLALEVKNLGLLSAVALNMMDLAEKQGIFIDLDKLSAALGVPIFPTVATCKKGLPELVNFIKTLSVSSFHRPLSWHPPSYSDLRQRTDEVRQLIDRCVIRAKSGENWTQKIDRILLHKYLGGPILALILLVIFQSVFSWAEPAMEAIELGIAAFGEILKNLLPDIWITRLLTDGILAGVGAVLVFLPQILILFFFIFLLEGSGYMMRAAFIMDHMMNKIGLPGRAFVPLLSSFACAIPGIMATRTLKSQRDRMVTMMIAPLMPCSARLPVYVLLIGAFVPNTPIAGPIKLQGLALFILFVVGVLSAMLVAWVNKKLAPEQSKTPYVFELPSYKWPHLSYIARQIFIRASLFVKNAGKIILMVSLAIWFLASYPKPPENANRPGITYSYAGQIGSLLEPLVAPIGFDWRIATGLIPGFAAREVMVGVLGTVFSVEHAEEDESALLSLQDKISHSWGLPTALSLLAWYIFAPQCLATLAILRRESNSWPYTLLTFTYLLALAYLAAFLVYRVSSFFV